METPERQNENPGRKKKKIRRLQLLRYLPGDSLLHRLDPRTKLLMLLAMSVVALLFSSLPVLILAFLFETALAVTSGLGKRFFQALTLVSPLFLIVILLDSFFTKVSSGQVWFSAQVGFLHPEVTTGGILFAVAMGLRLLTLVGISFLFIMTTSPDDFVRSLKSIRVPPTLTFSLGYALHSTTALTEDTRQIMDAQRSRGLELDRGNLIRNRNKLTALFIPVTVSLLKRSKNTADAMQARGFRQGVPHSCYKSHRFGHPDILMGIVLVMLILSIALVSLVLR
ncbi:MAG: energy-coupling factor transporter transmembrane component T [Methanoregulaceae archaeon]